MFSQILNLRILIFCSQDFLCVVFLRGQNRQKNANKNVYLKKKRLFAAIEKTGFVKTYDEHVIKVKGRKHA